MKKVLLLAILSASIFVTSCSKNTVDPNNGGGTTPPPVSTDGVVTVSGEITTATTWSKDKIYLLKGNVFVTNNATLKIEAGTIIKGDKVTKGALIITRGAKIDAQGTADAPIVFTSNQPAGGRKEGDWGGVIILGKARNNGGTDVSIEGISDATTRGKHGGTDDADNSGTLKYIRIEYAGVALSPDNEINGLTFGSVGSGTVVDYIEVYRSGDDAFEWFGGTVNAKHLLAIDSWDDDFDTDNGYSGKIQFGLAQRLAATADVSGSNGFESDNNQNGTNDIPQTSAIFSNMTILGPRETATPPTVNASFQHGAQIRRNSAISLFNSVIVGFPTGVFYDDAAPSNSNLNSSGNLAAGRSVFAYNIVGGATNADALIKASNANALAAITALLNPANGSTNTFTASLYGGGIYTDPYKFSADLAPSARAGVPNFIQIANSPALTGANFTHAKLAGFETVAYKGAFGATDWSAGWATYNPQTIPYTTPGVTK